MTTKPLETIKKRIPMLIDGKVVYIEGEIFPVWGEQLYKSLLWYNNEEIPVNHPRSPFMMIVTIDKSREMPLNLAFKRKLLPFEKDDHPFTEEKIISVDWMIMLNTLDSIALKMLDTTDPEAIASMDADCTVLAEGGTPVIVIVENDVAYEHIFNRSVFLGQRNPMLTLREIQIIIQGLYYKQIHKITKGGKSLNFLRFLQELENEYQNWELPITKQEAQQIMIRMKIREPRPVQEESVIDDTADKNRFDFTIVVNPEYNKVMLFYRIPENGVWNSIQMFQFDIYFSGGILLEKSVDLLEYYYVAETTAGEKIPFKSKEDPYKKIFNPIPQMAVHLLISPTDDFFRQVDEYGYYGLKIKGNRQNQIPNLRAFLRKYPDCLDAWTQLGLAEYVARQYDDAWSSLQIAHSFAERYPFNRAHQFSTFMLETLAKLYKALGWLCEKFDNYKMGVEYATKLSQLEPHSPYAWYNLGDFKKNLHRTEEALEAYHQGVSVAPENLDSIKFYADYLVECNRPQEAQKYYERISKLLKRNTPATRETKVCDMREIVTGNLTGFAKIANMDKKFKKARKFFSQASETDSNNPYNNRDWGMFEYEQGKFTKAFELIRKSLSIQETTPELFVVMGKLYLKKNQPRQAFDHFMRGFMKGCIHPTLELLQKLDPKVRQIAQLFPAPDQSLETLVRNTVEWLNLSQMYGKMNNFENAYRCCQMGLKADPKHHGLLNNSAFYASKLYYLDKAEEINQEILQMDSQNHYLSNEERTVNWQNRGSVALKRGDLINGINFLKKGSEFSPNRVDTILYLARAYYLNNEFEKALVLFRAVTHRAPREMRQFAEYFHRNSDIAQIEYKKLWKN